MSRFGAAMVAGLLALALAGQFVMTTALVDRVSPALAVASAALVAAVVVTLVSLVSGRAEPVFSRRDRVLAAVAGSLGLWLAPLMVAANRRSDAPSGTEVLFITTAAWGLLIVLGALASRDRRVSLTQVAWAILGCLGAAATVANWERPSSFSPFVKFPSAEIMMLVAGLFWMVAVRILEPIVKRYGPWRAARAAALPSAALAVVFGLAVDWPRVAEVAVPDNAAAISAAGFVSALVLLSWARGLSGRGPQEMAAAYFLPPLLLSGLSFVERATGVFGAPPILWVPAVWGSLLCVSAAFFVFVGGAASGAIPPPQATGAGPPAARPLLRAALAFTAAAACAAIVGLFRADLAVSVTGSLSSGPPFAADFSMLGFETVGGWLPLAAILLVGAEIWRRRADMRTPAPVALAAWMAAVALVLVSWLPLHTTPLHTWNGWIPPEVQQDYGTEYARLQMYPLGNPFEVAALVGAAIATGLLSLDRSVLRSSNAGALAGVGGDKEPR